MRLPNKELENQILQMAIELLMEKEPAEIGMRDVAKKCNVSATTIYNYYKDKNQLFMKISLFFLRELSEKMSAALKTVEPPAEKIRTALKVYRDWCFEKPEVALLVFSKLKETISDEDIMNFYICNRLGENLLAECEDKKLYKGKDVALDTGIIISGMWGCIESIITKRADPVFWNEGILFTDRFIEVIISSLIEEKDK